MSDPIKYLPNISFGHNSAEKDSLLYEGVLFKVGDFVKYGGGPYEIATFKHFPHGWMVGIYDERPHSNHIDFLQPRGLEVV